jgi:hypothetical protein
MLAFFKETHPLWRQLGAGSVAEKLSEAQKALTQLVDAAMEWDEKSTAENVQVLRQSLDAHRTAREAAQATIATLRERKTKDQQKAAAHKRKAAKAELAPEANPWQGTTFPRSLLQWLKVVVFGDQPFLPKNVVSAGMAVEEEVKKVTSCEQARVLSQLQYTALETAFGPRIEACVAKLTKFLADQPDVGHAMVRIPSATVDPDFWQSCLPACWGPLDNDLPPSAHSPWSLCCRPGSWRAGVESIPLQGAPALLLLRPGCHSALVLTWPVWSSPKDGRIVDPAIGAIPMSSDEAWAQDWVAFAMLRTDAAVFVPIGWAYCILAFPDADPLKLTHWLHIPLFAKGLLAAARADIVSATVELQAEDLACIGKKSPVRSASEAFGRFLASPPQPAGAAPTTATPASTPAGPSATE